MTDLTFIHIGDLHGHLLPRPNLRGDGPGGHEGGLARMATLIENGAVTVLTGTDGQALDVTEVVARHLSRHAATALDPGIGLSAPLPGPVHRNPEIQPLLGARRGT